MKDRFINFLLIFLLVILILWMFSNPEKSKELDWNILLESVSDSYSIPASPKLSLINNSSDDLDFNTCEDVKVRFNWENLVLSDAFCSDVNLKSGGTYIIDYNSQYKLFDKTWKYTFIFLYWDRELSEQFEVVVSWFIKKFFIWVFYAPVYNLMAYLLTITNYSLFYTIIIITIIIRLILVVPQHKMMVNQRKMQLIQPKIKEIQEKFKWNHQMLWMELMNLYKKEKVNPMWSCWLLLIQMPVLIVIYHIIISIQDPANLFYMYSFLSTYDLNLLVTDFYWFNLLETGWAQWFILALLVWLLQFIQIKLSLIFNKTENSKWLVLEKKKGASDYSSMMPDPEVMNKFMLIGMPIMVWVFTYTFFAWVWIYWWISTLFMIVQQYIVNKNK